MKKSAGIAVVCQGKILLCHPTNAPQKNSYSIPKGLIEDGEDELEAAIRETKEEVGIDLSALKGRIEKYETIEYVSNGTVYKTVVAYFLKIDSYSEIGMKGDCVPNEQLQSDEIDWAGFIGKEEASEKIFWRLSGILKLIK
jgi:ADP-ribose pyrophosphatase YjhB (NUDIX family)